MSNTLSRYFALRFLRAAIAVFGGIFVLVALVDYMELLRHSGRHPNASALLVAQTSLYRVPQLTERILPFALLIAGMSSFLSLSRRNELVVARAAGISAWQFIAPAVAIAIGIGVLATAIYNPLAARLFERSKELEARIQGNRGQSSLQMTPSGFWIRQKSSAGEAIIHALASRDEGIRLDGVTIFTFDQDGTYDRRIIARTATLKEGYFRLEDARVISEDEPPTVKPILDFATNLSLVQVRERFATPESVSIWDLPSYIASAEHAGVTASGYRLQFQKLLARPVLLAAVILLAAVFSLRFFRFGGVQKMVIGGVLSGFLLYVVSKLLDDLSTASVIWPSAAAWLPALGGIAIGVVALLHQEDG